MLSAAHLRANLLVKLGEMTGRTHALPLVLFAPTARCNSRCISCDWWRADGAADLSLAEIERVAEALPHFGTRLVVFTGGEPLVRPDVMAVADVFRTRGLVVHLLTSGLALERFAEDIAARFGDVTISLDAHTADLYREIRGVNGLEAVTAGVRKLRALAPALPIRARSTIHRRNFRHLPQLIARAMEMGVDQISFLAADVTSGAFNRGAPQPSIVARDVERDTDRRGDAPAASLLLSAQEADELATIVEAVIESPEHAAAFAARRIAPGPEGLRRLARYYRAQLGLGPFPPVDCNAPWVSVVIEADGSVRPCFFHAPVGNLRHRPLPELLAEAMPAFRDRLDVGTDQTCAKCVCTLRVGLRSKLW